VPDARYERAKSYKAFKSVPEYLAAGGRLRKGMDSNAPSDTFALAETGYSKDRFGNGWADVDGDCQNSRAEALIEKSTAQVQLPDESRCRVVTGRWISPFISKVIHNAFVQRQSWQSEAATRLYGGGPSEPERTGTIGYAVRFQRMSP
jgi:hypothetical protein